METNEILKQVNTLICEVLEDDSIVVNLQTTAVEVEGWDSLNHAILVAEVQKKFKIRFDLSEVLKFKNVGDMCFSIQKKLNN